MLKSHCSLPARMEFADCNSAKNLEHQDSAASKQPQPHSCE